MAHEAEIHFQVELVCEELKTTEVVSLGLPCFPSSFDDVKKAIEKSFSIPSFLQTLWVDGAEIDNQSSGIAPSQFYLQAGDTIKVSFPMKCDCEKVKEVTKWLSECLDIIHSFQNASSEKEQRELFHKGSSRLYDYDIIQCLIEDLFVPWDDKMKQTSAWYFDHLGGTTSLVQIHKGVRSLVKNAKFEAVRVYGIFFESISCDAFTNFAADTALRRQATARGAFECVLNTFVEAIVTNLEPNEVIEDSLMSICNISDTPENRIYIAQKRDVIEQVLRVIGATSCYSNHTTRVAIIVLANMAQCKEAQKHLLREEIIGKVLDTVSNRRLVNLTEHSREVEIKLLICYTGVLMAQLILGSPQLLHGFQESTLHKLETILEEVLKLDPAEIGKLECDENVTWGSFAPLMYLYEPYISFNSPGKADNKRLLSLSHLSIDILLNSLDSAVWRKEHVQVLNEEELLDFVVMAPWFVPFCSQERARQVVHQLTRVQSLQPPSLSTICKANIAKMKVGLISITDTIKSVSQMYSEFFL